MGLNSMPQSKWRHLGGACSRLEDLSKRQPDMSKVLRTVESLFIDEDSLSSVRCETVTIHKCKWS